MKIAVMTWFQNNNYGTVLQAAALTRVLKNMGHEADIIQYASKGKASGLPRGSEKAEFMEEAKAQLDVWNDPEVTEREYKEIFNAFRQKYLHITDECITLSDLENLNEKYDAFICGSDRIWSASSFDPHYFLDFVSDPAKMIAYAPCILNEGMSDPHIQEQMRQLIARFRHLSVREESGRKLMNDLFKIRTEEMADPTLMLSAQQWEEAFGQNWTEYESRSLQSDNWSDSFNAAAGPKLAPESAPGEDTSSNTSETFQDASSVILQEDSRNGQDPVEHEGGSMPLEPERIRDIPPEVLAEEASSDRYFDQEDHQELPPDPSRYLLITFQSNHTAYWDAANKLAARMNLSVRVIPVHESDMSRYGAVTEPIGPSEYVDLIRKAEYVCTDSYHALLLAITFQKEICCFYRFDPGAKEDRNDRIHHILDALGMLGRLYENEAPLERYLEKTDYIPVRYKLDALRLKSRTYLINSLLAVEEHNAKIQKKILHVREGYRLCCGCGACIDVCPQDAISMRRADNGFLEAFVQEEKCIRCGECTSVCPVRGKRSGIVLSDGYLLSYTDENGEELQRSDGGAFAWRISSLLAEKGIAVAGCTFDSDSMCASHIIVCPDGTVLRADEPGKAINEENPEPDLSEQNKWEKSANPEDTDADVPEKMTRASEEESGASEEEAWSTSGASKGESEAAAGASEEESGASEGESEAAAGASEEEAETASSDSGEEAWSASAFSQEEAEISASTVEKETSSAEEQIPVSEIVQEKLHQLQGARFLQSNLTGIWGKIRQLSCPVIFFGTPCQVAAARKVLPERNDIIYVDMICSGVPSALLFEKYRKSFRKRSTVSKEHFEIQFLGGANGKKDSFIRLSDGVHEKKVSASKNSFGRMLNQAGCSGEFCYDCRWRDRSCADLRLGNSNGRSFSDGNGDSLLYPQKANFLQMLSAGLFGSRTEDVSVIFCMTPKGKQVLDLLMTEGYWEGLHKQKLDPYLAGIRTINAPRPAYYTDLIQALSDERISMRKVVSEYAKPLEKRSRAVNRWKRFTRIGRKLSRMNKKAAEAAANEDFQNRRTDH